MKFQKVKMIVFLCVIYLVVSTICIFSQCAMCKGNILASENGVNLAKKINNAILFLVAAPYIIAGTIAYNIYRKNLNNKEDK
jgi:hypothetical protein